jgi:hypothetical protein
MEKRMEDMIHETLEGGGGIIQDKGHDQELIVTLMSSKGSLGNSYSFHMYLVVAKTKIKFSKVLNTTQFIQDIINERNVKLIFDGEFIEGKKFRTHAPSTFFIENHDHRIRIGSGTREDNTHLEKLLHDFFNFIILRKGTMIRENIWRNTFGNKGNGMNMNTIGR